MNRLIPFLLLLACCSAHAQASYLTATPAITDGSAPIVLNWNVIGATSCVASGGKFTGSRPAAGTGTYAITADTPFRLVCKSTTLRVTWEAVSLDIHDKPQIPTGYRVYTGPSETDLSLAAELGNVLETRLTGLSPGLLFVSVRAFDAAKIESQGSAIASITIGSFTLDAPVKFISAQLKAPARVALGP